MRVVLHPEARREFRRAALWYEERSPGLGDEFVGAVTATLHRIGQRPRRFHPGRSYVGHHGDAYERAERRKLETHPNGAASTIRCLHLYVACTRARDYLLVTGVAPASEFLDDLRV